MNFSLREARKSSALPLQRDDFESTDDLENQESALPPRYPGRSKLVPQQASVSGVAIRKERKAPRRVDLVRVQPDVLLAKDLTPGQEKDVYFPLERYRLLGTRIMQTARNLKTKTFLITSAIAEEGKTLTTLNLGFALSGASSLKVLLVDMDLRRPSLASSLGVADDKGRSSFLQDDDWQECLWELKPNLHALMLTLPARHPEEAVHSEQVKRILEEARTEYDLIVLDSAPLLLAVDTHVLLPMVDHALLVVRADHTPINCTQDAAKMLGEKILGCILNDVKKMKYEEYYRAYYK